MNQNKLSNIIIQYISILKKIYIFAAYLIFTRRNYSSLEILKQYQYKSKRSKKQRNK